MTPAASHSHTAAVLRGEEEYVRVAVSERLTLRDKRGELAGIALGHHDGFWVYRVDHQQFTGDMWGSGGPLSLHKGRTETFPDRDAALAGAIAHARQRWAGREREMAPHFAWLDTLVPAQPDLFGVAA